VIIQRITSRPHLSAINVKKMAEFNKTQLNVYESIERGIVHRDYYAHLFRWTHVLKLLKINQQILDFGCGSAGLLETMYRNKYSPTKYLGLDIRSGVIESSKVKYSKLKFAEFKCQNLVDDFNYGNNWDIICSFEVIEHVNKKNAVKFLDNLKNHCSENTIVMLSTPVYNPTVGAAGNHTYDGQVQEYKYEELKSLLEVNFEIIKTFGTFASQKDYIGEMTNEEKRLLTKFLEYYDSNVISIIFAPLFPKQSRNCLWQLKLKSSLTQPKLI
jgi:2-polyprenyl-3-methyl-5-hydroxy-6-metoxy-1,4-benzoquinol methylase